MPPAIFHITSLDRFINLNFVMNYLFYDKVGECVLYFDKDSPMRIEDKNDAYRLKEILKGLSMSLVKSLPK